ncbi:hypothetical protein GHT06_011175 [Daphnia sinensis]|uniref:Mpv17-like protein 2 n=1 Tax=Daphnia sinensis TaxID=1820382 RepID=A0AAD5LJ70_9CRUS|nr:hypothetical protein GHT06_011175 [Daphnia sinensis]
MAVISKLKGILFGRYLWVTNTASGGILLAAGDLIQQTIEHSKTSGGKKKNKERYDWKRSGRMMAIGLTLGLPHHFWYKFLDHAIPGASLLCVGKKILLDQTIFSPFNNVSFFMGAGLLEGNTTRQAWDELKSKFLMVYKTDCSVWPPAQFINFFYVSPVYRVLYVNVLTVGWNVFLSYAKYFDKANIRVESDLPAIAMPL